MVALAVLAAAPVFATRYITYHMRTVRARGSCNKRFEAMYTTLARATGAP
jgi:hypothetical protein